MQEAAGWQTREDYARFLALQYASRRAVEAWLEENAPADFRPPPQTPHIAADLADLGETLPGHAHDFALPLHEGGTDRWAALGVAWVLAGSALGNRSILAQMHRIAKAQRSAAPRWPERFLGDAAMLDFWNKLRTRIERPAPALEAERAAAGASAVFDHFIARVAETRSAR